MVRLRLKKLGRRHRPFYRIAAFDARAPRDGRAIEENLGTYDPLEPDNDKKAALNRERIVYWLEHGAQPSEAVASILRKNGVYVGRRSKSSRRKKKTRQATGEGA